MDEALIQHDGWGEPDALDEDNIEEE